MTSAEDPLSRLARREELLRRINQSTEPAPARTAVPLRSPMAQPPGAADPQPSSGPVAELADAIRLVVERHPDIRVSATVDHAGAVLSLWVDRTDGAVTVTVTRDGSAVKIAELLRDDPSALVPGKSAGSVPDESGD